MRALRLAVLLMFGSASHLLAGCCEELVPFEVVLRSSAQQFPEDLLVTLTHDDVGETWTLTRADMESASPNLVRGCTLTREAGKPHEVIRCGWGGAGTGTFEATAAGHETVFLVLFSHDEPCRPRMEPREATLHPL